MSENNKLRLFLDCLSDLQEHEVNVTFFKKKYTELEEGSHCRGYWDDGDKANLVLKCSVSHEWDTDDFLAFFTHEYCHFVQWKKKTKIWAQCSKYDQDTFDLILHNKPIKEDLLKNALSSYRDIEVDCEKRTVNLLKKYGINFDYDNYIKRANCYIHFYNYIKTYRSWYPRGKEPYAIKELIKVASNEFQSSYKKIPPEMLEVFLKIYPLKRKSRLLQ